MEQGAGSKEAVAAEPEEGRWERWQKRRVFVRELAGKYAEVYRQLLQQPRVYDPAEMPWKGGPQAYGKKVVNPQRTAVTQMIEAHLDAYGPGAKGVKHGHMNSAVFYILDGRGYDVHDGVRYPWEAGDVCIVQNACVHQHFNADPDRPVKVLVFKAKPLVTFAHLLFQKVVDYPPDDPMPGHEAWTPDEEGY